MNDSFVSSTPNPQPFDYLNFVVEYGGLEITWKVLSHLGMVEEAESVWDTQCHLTYIAAESAVKNGDWDYSTFLSFYPALSGLFLEVEEKKAYRDRVNKLRRPGANGKITVYCPRGCNQIQVHAEEPWEDCAACGRLMTASAEDSYYDVLVQAGQA
jgi:hypothetical protein